MLLTVYFAACALAYDSPNLWAGTLVVALTAILVVAATGYAFKMHNHFAFGFSTVASTLLILIFGFCSETDATTADWSLPSTVYEIASLGYETPIITFDKPVHVYGKRHSIYGSAQLASQGDMRHQPGFHNVVRLAACLMSLIAGLFGGFVFRLAAVRINRRRDLEPL